MRYFYYRLFFQHFRQNSAGRKLPKFQNSGKIFAKTHKFLLKLANFCSKLSFPAKLSNIYYIRVLEKLTDLVKTQPNFKTQPRISPKLSFPAILVAVHAAQSLKKKPALKPFFQCFLARNLSYSTPNTHHQKVPLLVHSDCRTPIIWKPKVLGCLENCFVQSCSNNQ